MDAQHTPGPWEAAVEIFDNEGYPETAIQALNGSATVAVALEFGQNNPHMREANARLIAAAPELLAAQTMGASANTPDFLEWIADRLVHQHGENPQVDFVLSLRKRAAAGRAAIAKATGATK